MKNPAFHRWIKQVDVLTDAYAEIEKKAKALSNDVLLLQHKNNEEAQKLREKQQVRANPLRLKESAALKELELGKKKSASGQDPL